MRFCKVIKIVTAIWILVSYITLVIFLKSTHKDNKFLKERGLSEGDNEVFELLNSHKKWKSFAGGGNGRGGVKPSGVVEGDGSGGVNAVGAAKAMNKLEGGSGVLGIDKIISNNNHEMHRGINDKVNGISKIIKFSANNDNIITKKMLVDRGIRKVSYKMKNNIKTPHERNIKAGARVNDSIKRVTPMVFINRMYNTNVKKIFINTNRKASNNDIDDYEDLGDSDDSDQVNVTYPRRSSYFKYKMDRVKRLWPKGGVDANDRVLNQILYYKPIPEDAPKKVIYMATGIEGDNQAGQSRFLQHQCPVNWCSLTDESKFERTADLIYYKDYATGRLKPTNPNQVKLLFMLESPMNTNDLSNTRDINWTATYRRDSVLNAPYERFTYFRNFTGIPEKANRNYAFGKTKMVAWFVSNCIAINGRTKYVEELSKHISVEIYGRCGSKVCIKDSNRCFKLLQKRYKFYLAFENSNCKDYITEKFFKNALNNNVLPIVMGARIEDYKRLAPPHSFIHIDQFQSPKQLAEYLHKLDKDEDLYNSYFRWKGVGEMIDTKFWCRLCHMLHARDVNDTRAWYSNVEDWWRGEGVCVTPDAGGSGWSTWNHTTPIQLSPSVQKSFNIVHKKLESKKSVSIGLKP